MLWSSEPDLSLLSSLPSSSSLPPSPPLLTETLLVQAQGTLVLPLGVGIDGLLHDVDRLGDEVVVGHGAWPTEGRREGGAGEGGREGG